MKGLIYTAMVSLALSSCGPDIRVDSYVECTEIRCYGWTKDDKLATIRIEFLKDPNLNVGVYVEPSGFYRVADREGVSEAKADMWANACVRECRDILEE